MWWKYVLTTRLWNKQTKNNQTNKQETIECIQLSPVWKVGHEYMTGNLENSQQVNMQIALGSVAFWVLLYVCYHIVTI